MRNSQWCNQKGAFNTPYRYAVQTILSCIQNAKVIPDFSTFLLIYVKEMYPLINKDYYHYHQGL